VTGRHRAAILLGSNIAPERNLPAALQALRHHPEMWVVSVSSTYETEPVGRSDQPRFLNAAVLVETPLGPGDLRRELREIEVALGRVRTEDKYAPRPIDLDVMLYDDLVQEFHDWRLPDPDVLDQPHALIPLADAAPDWVHPETGSTLEELAAGLDPGGVRRRL
jgi:2-amino-4-hydroxy-6-hydroxymethyldihydropteridine diphosphokinase